MTKVDIVNRILDEVGLQKPEAEEAVETIISLIKNTLGEGDPVILRRFGSFQVRQKSRADRTKTQKQAKRPPSVRVKLFAFKAGKYFKAAVNNIS